MNGYKKRERKKKENVADKKERSKMFEAKTKNGQD